MNIGFDFDKVFIDYPPVIPDYFFDRFYKKKANGQLLYRIPSKPEQTLRLLTHLPYLRPVIKENLRFLKTLPQEKHHLYLISSRFGFLEEVTDRIVKKHGFDKIFDELFFNFRNEQPHTFKNKVIKKLKLDVYIDDDLPLVRYVAKDNRQTQFYWLNSKITGTISPNITAITKLSDISHTTPKKNATGK